MLEEVKAQLVVVIVFSGGKGIIADAAFPLPRSLSFDVNGRSERLHAASATASIGRIGIVAVAAE